MSKYKVGDKVRVKNDLEINKIYGGFKATSKRLSFSNKIVTIKNIFPCIHNVLGEVYGIEEDNDYWTDKMFEGKVNDMTELEKLKEQILEIQKKIEELERKEYEEENKQIFKEDDIYYSVNSYGEILKNTWEENKYDKGALSILNCFKTKDEAEFELERKKVIAEMKKFAFEPDWDSFNQRKWLICRWNNNIETFYTNDIQYGNIIYFKSEEIIKKCIEYIGEDKIRKYYLGIK